MRPHSSRVLSTAGKLLGVAALAVVAAACSEADVLEVHNSCPDPARVVTWGGSEPVLDVAAGGVAETTSFSHGPVSLVTSKGLVKLTPSEPDYDGGPSRYVVSVLEAQCDDLGDDIVDVIVVDDIFMGEDPDPVRIRLYSADPMHLHDPTPIVSALTGAATTTTSQGPGYLAVEFVPGGPTDWNGEDIEFDATDVVDAALSIAGPGTVVLNCPSYDCAMVTAAADRLTSPFTVKAQTAGTVTGNETYETILGLVIIAILVATPVVIITRMRRRRRHRRSATPGLPPPTVPR